MKWFWAGGFLYCLYAINAAEDITGAVIWTVLGLVYAIMVNRHWFKGEESKAR